MNSPRNAWCGLIDCTNFCSRGCVYCTRNDRHLSRQLRYHMSLDMFEHALVSYNGFPGMIGIIGGEPQSHPQFIELCRICRKHFPREKLVLFTSVKVPRYQSVIAETFKTVHYHPHIPAQEKRFYHQPLTIAIKDVVPDPALRAALIDDCWLQRKWCPTITDDGAFFCEVAASIAKLRGVKGWPINSGWWDVEPCQFGAQLENCQFCGMCIPMPRQKMCDKREKISPSYLRLLQERDLPLGDYELFNREITPEEMRTAVPNWTPGYYKAEQLKERPFEFSRLDWRKWSITIDVFTLCWNEKRIIPFFLDHYKFARSITVYDNESTDGSGALLAANPKVILRQYQTGGKSYETIQRDLRNRCWKQSDADWVIVCDMDEFVYHPDGLETYLRSIPGDVAALRVQTYEMVSDKFPRYNGRQLVKLIKTGQSFQGQPNRFLTGTKAVLFRPSMVEDINFGLGSHECSPKFKGNYRIVDADDSLKLLHYKYLGLDYVINRKRALSERLSDENIRNKLNVHWARTPQQIEEDYTELNLIKQDVVTPVRCVSVEKPIKLPNVTLFCICGEDYEEGERALIYSMRGFEFGEVKLISPYRPKHLDERIIHCPIAPFPRGKIRPDGGRDPRPLSEFVIKRLPDFINTEYGWCIHTDGFIINPHLWRDEFLDYDYIGAPFNQTVLPDELKKQRVRVGCGGNCIRSKRLMRHGQTYADFWDGQMREDYWFSGKLPRQDFKFAPIKLAMQFCMDTIVPEFPHWNENMSLGFHGKFHRLLLKLVQNKSGIAQSKLISLPNVTLVCICGERDAEDGVRALLYSMRGINFGKVKLLCCVKPDNLSNDIEFVKIPPFEGKDHRPYSRFVIERLNDFIDTQFALIIHTDGFITHPELWQFNWLDYDYIGAPWHPRLLTRANREKRVGNGGFSLRSKRILAYQQQNAANWNGQEEDSWLAHVLPRKDFKFAPLNVAMRFSVEEIIPEFPDWHTGLSFGFHGKRFHAGIINEILHKRPINITSISGRLKSGKEHETITKLPQITLICVCGADVELGHKALLYSMREIEFGEVKLLSCVRPYELDTRITFCQIPAFGGNGQAPYSQFIVNNLADYFHTDYVLLIHSDGFVINPHLWRSAFLEFDYIGAPIHPRLGWTNRVGNGGFSLRSKRLCEHVKSVAAHWRRQPEDLFVCCLMPGRDKFKFAPLRMAIEFSIEETVPEFPRWSSSQSFGFHGKRFHPNLVALLGTSAQCSPVARHAVNCRCQRCRSEGKKLGT